MLNKPGTLLVVRRYNKKYPQGGWGDTDGIPSHVFWKIRPSDIDTPRNQRQESAFYRRQPLQQQPSPPVSPPLPYGTVVMLISFLPARNPDFGASFRRMVLLHGTDYLEGHLSNSQANKWFTYAPIWNKHYKNRKISRA